jgi:hypothetical protein
MVSFGSTALEASGGKAATLAINPDGERHQHMARLPATTLLAATLRTRVAEDQLTEMLAHLLDRDDDLLTNLRWILLVPENARKVSILTQRRTPAGNARIDLELRFAGLHDHVVWVEVKDESPESPGQLARYETELAEHSPHSHTLVALAPAGHTILSAERVQPLTWQSVARICETVGASRGGRNWRRSALEPTAESRQRSLVEFVEFLQQRRLALNTEPITALDALVAPRVEALLGPEGTIASVLDAAVAAMDGFDEDPSARWSKRLDAWHGRVLIPSQLEIIQATSTFASSKPYVALSFVPSDDWDREEDPRHSPAFAAGIWSEQPEDSLIAQLSKRKPPTDVFVHARQKDCSARMLLYLGEIANVGTTVTEQGEALGRWATRAIEHVATVFTSTS